MFVARLGTGPETSATLTPSSNGTLDVSSRQSGNTHWRRAGGKLT